MPLAVNSNYSPIVLTRRTRFCVIFQELILDSSSVCRDALVWADSLPNNSIVPRSFSCAGVEWGHVAFSFFFDFLWWLDLHVVLRMRLGPIVSLLHDLDLPFLIEALYLDL